MEKLHLSTEDQGKLNESVGRVMADSYTRLQKELFTIADVLIEGDRLFALKERIKSIQDEEWSRISSGISMDIRSHFICKTCGQKEPKPVHYSREEYSRGMEVFIENIHHSIYSELDKLSERLNNLFEMIFLDDKQQNRIGRELEDITDSNRKKIIGNIIRGVTLVFRQIEMEDKT